MVDINENLFQRIFEEHSAVMLLIEPTCGTIIKANQAAARFYGYTEHQLSQMRIQDINLLPSELVAQERKRALNDERNHFIFPHRQANGEQRMVEVHSSPIIWQGSTILFSIIHDITSRQEIKQALQESEHRFRTLFDSAPDAIFLADIETGVIVDANLAATRLLLKPQEEIIGLHFTELHPPELLSDSHNKFLKHILKSESADINPIEHFALRADGSAVPIEVTAKILNFNQQRYLLGVFRDITQRRQMEMALRESEERLQLAIEGNNDGLWDWNAVTNKVIFSRRWKEMIGYQEDEISDEVAEWEKRIHAEDREAVYADLNKHLNGETPFYQNEHRLQCKDGSYKWVLDRGKVISWTEENKPLRVVGTHTDVTARKKIEIENQRLVKELSESLRKVKLLSGFLPICANCKKIRDDQGYWTQIEGYIRDHSEAEFSHSICPDCAKTLYSDIYKAREQKT